MVSSERDIAIVGMGCRFPDAVDTSTFWGNILERHISFRPPDDRRWNHESFYSENRRAKNATYARHAAQLRDVESFAASQFGISPKRAHHMDPQQRLMLEVTREALQDAGLERRPWDREDSAVFVGVSLSEYANAISTPLRTVQLNNGRLGQPGQVGEQVCDDVTTANAYTLLGSNISMCASCLSQAFDCRGPSLAIDAACASSLAATVQGVQYLRGLAQGQAHSPIVLVGGVYLNLLPDNAVCFAKIGALAEQQCRPFDAKADGFVLGEGAATIVLKRYQDAVRDQDRIYAVIKGASWNNDGVSSSPATPSKEGQVKVMRAGLRDAGFPPESLGYIECHGTGTMVGDPIEISSLLEVFPEPSAPRLGSVKANIGHTLGASGLAGLIKAASALYHRTLPPQAGWQSWHPSLPEQVERFSISAKRQAWDSSQRAAISSFAFGGTNCFVALEPAQPEEQPSASSDEELLFTFSAPNAELLGTYLSLVRPHIALGPALDSVARTLASRKRESQIALIKASSVQQLLERLDFLQDCLLEPSKSLLCPTPGCLFGPNPIEGDPAVEPAWQKMLSLPWDAPQTGGKGTLCELPPIPLLRPKFWFTKSIKKAPKPGAAPRPDRNHHPLVQQLREQAEIPPEVRLEQALSDAQLESLPFSAPPGCSLLDLVELAQSESPRSEEPICELNRESHPYLLDHSLRGRPILPLASALDLMTQGVPYPFAIRDIKVNRGLMVRKPTSVKVIRDESQVRLMEVRANGREVLAFEATVGVPGEQPTSFTPERLYRPRMSLAQFYSGLAFHGPRLQGILDILGICRRSLQGRVRPSTVCDWIPDSPRRDWNLDPLVIDSAFQMAMFWCMSQAGKGLLPESIEEIVALGPFGLRAVRVEVTLQSVDENGVVGDFHFYSNGQLRGWMRGARGKFVPAESLRRVALKE